MTTTLTIRIDSELKAQAGEFFDDIGMSLTTAVNCFFKKCLDVGEIPFALGRKKSAVRKMLQAKAEADRLAEDPDAPCCTDADKLEEFLFS